MSIQIKGWSKFQHFKDRKPLWIKLYRDILDDVEWFELSAESAKTLVMLWLIASETDGYLPDIKTISFRIRKSEKETEKLISTLNHWLVQDDINLISNVYQLDSLEKRRDREEIEKEKRESKNMYGPFQNVSLTDDECQKLIEKYGNDESMERIERLSSYIASKGVKYKSHYATILSWASKDTSAVSRRPKTFAEIKEERGMEQMRQFVEGV